MASAGGAQQAQPAIVVVDPSLLHIENPDLSLGFKQNGGCLYKAILKNFHAQVNSPQPVEVNDNHLPCAALGVRWGQTDLRSIPARVQVNQNGHEIVFEQDLMGVVVRRIFSVPSNGFEMGLTLQVVNNSAQAVQQNLGLDVGLSSEHKASGSFLGRHPVEQKEVVVKSSEKLYREKLPFVESPQLKEVLRVGADETIEWVASGSGYFSLLLLPQQSISQTSFLASGTGLNLAPGPGVAPDHTAYEGWLEHPLQIAPSATTELKFKVYLGPKTKENLAKYGQSVTQLIDYGFFKIVAWPIFYALSFLHGLLKNWGLAIIVLTFSIKLLFYPLTLRAYLAGKKMQKIQPLLNEVKEKYKDDKAKQSQEIMGLMAKSGANPMSGCLPILPQMPVFFALYAVLQHTFELRHAPFFFWIFDLSSMDPFYVSPLILGLLMFLQQKLTPMPSVDPTQAKMMQFLPIVFTLLMISLPSGLVLYMLTNTAMSILQQQYMMRKYKEA